MIKQQFCVESYWKVIVYYNLDYNFFFDITRELKRAGINKTLLQELQDNMQSGKAKAVTYSNTKQHISIVLFNKHESIEDYINSLVHEAEHIKQAMLRAYKVRDTGENPAYTIGYLVMRMWQVFKEILTGLW